MDAFAGPSEATGEALSPHALTTSRGFKPATALVEVAVGKLKASLAKRGCDAIMRLGRRFRIMDDDASNGLCFDEVRAPVQLTVPLLLISGMHETIAAGPPCVNGQCGP